MPLGPFDLEGPEFLRLYCLLLGAALLLSVILPRLFRPQGARHAHPDTERMAILAGGPARLAESAAVRMMHRKSLLVGSGGQLLPGTALPGAGALETVIHRALPSRWSAVEKLAHDHAVRLRPAMAAQGYLLDGADVARLRLLQTLPLVALLAFGAIKLFIGHARDRPIGFLTALLVVTAILALIRFAKVERRTQSGLDVVASARRDEARLKVAPREEEADRAVALFGTGVLAASAFAALHDLRRSEAGGDGGSGGSGGSSDSDGGGGCGGGCGGCGG